MVITQDLPHILEFLSLEDMQNVVTAEPLGVAEEDYVAASSNNRLIRKSVKAIFGAILEVVTCAHMINLEAIIQMKLAPFICCIDK